MKTSVGYIGADSFLRQRQQPEPSGGGAPALTADRQVAKS